MPLEINVTDEDIQYAEKILLPEGKTFDAERKRFIRNFDVIDLQAVPGSGKTTALLAKLLILERNLPFQDDSGILIISHTNAAIDEIKYKIEKHCPKLFSYPNFIGTMQSFVDEFLAIPFYQTKFKKKPIRIDNEIYNEAIDKHIKLNITGFSTQEQKNARYFLFGNECQHSFRFDYQNGEIRLMKSINGEELEIIKPRRGRQWQDFTTQEKAKVKDWLKKFKLKIMEKEGILHFDDAYWLADVYLNKIPSIKNIIQKRFSYVFVDEMQDMDSHQYRLLEKLFYDEGNSISVIQRIGDKNQAIYNAVRATEIWDDRTAEVGSVLRLKASQRLSKPIGEVVKNFALYTDENFDISGLNTCTLKPHILVFQDNSTDKIIPRFAQIVKEHRENGNITDLKNPVKVICWNTEWKEQTDKENISKLRLTDYHSTFKKDKAKPKLDYVCLKSYLIYYDKKKNILEPAKKNILNAFLKILRLEGITDQSNRPYTRKKLIDFLRIKDQIQYDQFNQNLYNWSINLIKGNINQVWAEIKEYAPNFFNIYSENNLSNSLAFINADVAEENTEDQMESAENMQNIYKEDGLEIEITSIHAVKGQTHSATLYLESYFQKDGTGTNAKSYESQRLAAQFLGNPIRVSSIGDRVKQSAKMAYVGLSRPTNLLCVAVHKTRFDQYLTSINQDEWEILEIT